MQNPRSAKGLPALLLGFFVGCILGQMATALADETDPPIKATLLADSAAVTAGKPFKIGVLLEIRPGWHTYWLYPGDSGMKTSVKFEAPPGFVVSDLRYPTPRQFNDLDSAVVFGYSDSVLLTAVVTPPTDPAQLPGGKADFHAASKWLCCKSVCIAGKSQCDLSLPISAATPANETLFAATQKSIPVPLGEPACPATGTIHTEHTSNGLAMTAEVQWSEPPVNVEFFPATDSALKITDILVRSEGGHTALTFKAQTLQGMTLSSPTLMAVIACSDEHGVRRGVQVHFDLK